MVDAKLSHLKTLLKSYGSCLIAYSGGVDSVLLAFVAHEVLGSKALAVIADSPSLPRRELEEALAIANRFGFAVKVAKTSEFDDSNYLQNPVNRCYFCKHALFAELAPLARAQSFAVIAYGENASDIGDHRPGSLAADKFSIRAPLREVGLTKAEIREISASLNLPTADKPQMACLSSRIPTGESVTVEKLEMIEKTENLLRDWGFHDVRVRHHELGSKSDIGSIRYLARIELGAAEIDRLFTDKLFPELAERARSWGYAYVTLDLAGYSRGSTNGTQLIQFKT
jgi:pyridinium-3,5-biscarboxylic acid mononucleotide sulfurtransferase